MTCRGFTNELSIDSPAPGGGSAAALMGALGAALDSMVANLTVKDRKCRKNWSHMRELAPEAQRIQADLLKAIDDDTEAFNSWMAANRQDGDVISAVKEAIAVPLRVLEQCPEIVSMAALLEEKGMQTSLSDAGVAAAAARAAAMGAYYNVLINLPEVSEDVEYAGVIRKRAEDSLAEVLRGADAVLDRIRTKLIKGLEG